MTETVTIKRGEKFSIVLESSPTTGYAWFPEFNRSLIDLVSHEFDPSSLDHMGSPGKDIFTFRATRAGSDNLRMFYKRSWEERSAAEKTFVIKIN